MEIFGDELQDFMLNIGFISFSIFALVESGLEVKTLIKRVALFAFSIFLAQFPSVLRSGRRHLCGCFNFLVAFQCEYPNALVASKLRRYFYIPLFLSLQQCSINFLMDLLSLIFMQRFFVIWLTFFLLIGYIY